MRLSRIINTTVVRLQNLRHLFHVTTEFTEAVNADELDADCRTHSLGAGVINDTEDVKLP